MACVITSDEDDVLNALGLRERIPLNYKEPFNNFADNFEEIEDHWARYKVAQNEDIVKKHIKGKEPLSQIYKVEWNESYNEITSIKKFSLEE